MRKYIVIGLAIAVLVIGWLVTDRILNEQRANASLETEPVRRDDLNIIVEAPGVVRANQSALLRWKTTGRVDAVYPSLEDEVLQGELLANLEQTSLPQNVILARAEQINAQRALDNLLTSQVRRAEVQKTVEQASQALDDARHPAQIQSNAQTALAEAQKSLEEAERNYEIIAKPPSQSAIDQAYANLLLAENQLNDTLEQIDRIQRRASRPEDKMMFFESRELYQQILEGLELKEIQDRRSYEDSLARYNRLIEPPNPYDLAVAEAELARAKAQLAQAQIEWERVKDGVSPAEIAVLEAQLVDAQREWQRWENGPDSAEITAAEARLAVARATLNQAQIVAPFDGTITAIYSQPGDIVSPGSQAFRLDDLTPLLVDARVPEIDINKIQPGQAAILSFDAIPNQEYLGTVVEVPAVGDVVENVASFKVVVEITNADEKIRPEMTTTLSIVVTELSDVLLVPNRALRLSQVERIVYVLRNGEMVPVSLALGAGSDAYTQILAGDLEEGELIVLNPPSTQQATPGGIEE
jgi:HlyD family secretion protein